MAYFPFHRLGYRCNPFRVLTEDEWAEVAVAPPELDAALAGEAHLQLLGEAGRGKSTTLRAAAAALRAAGREVRLEYLPEGAVRFRTDPRGAEVFCLDEAQRLARGERSRLLRLPAAGVRLVLTSHEDLAPLFTRERLPLVTLQVAEESPGALHRILRRRLEYFALPGAAPAGITEAEVRALRDRFGTDLRAMERHLYEVLQERASG